MNTTKPTPTWRAAGSLLSLLFLAALWGLDALRGEWAEGLHGEVQLSTLVFLGIAALLYGTGSKLSDLTNEHGLEHAWLKVLGYFLALGGLIVIAPTSAGVTFVAAEIGFHGVVKGKADTATHAVACLVVCPLVLLLFALAPQVRVDWLSVGLLVGINTAWSLVGRHRPALGKSVVRRYGLGMGALLAVLGLAVSPARFLPLAVIAVAERSSYAYLRSYAHQQAWHRA